MRLTPINCILFLCNAFLISLFNSFLFFIICVDSSCLSVTLIRVFSSSPSHVNTASSPNTVKATCGCIWMRIQPAGHTSSCAAAATTISLIRHNWQNISTGPVLFTVYPVLLVSFCHSILLARPWPRPPFLAPLLLPPVAITLSLLSVHRRLSVCLPLSFFSRVFASRSVISYLSACFVSPSFRLEPGCHCPSDSRFSWSVAFTSCSSAWRCLPAHHLCLFSVWFL